MRKFLFAMAAAMISLGGRHKSARKSTKTTLGGGDSGLSPVSRLENLEDRLAPALTTLSQFAVPATSNNGVAFLETEQGPRVAVASGPGSSPEVRMYDMAGTLTGVIHPYESSFHGGIFVAAGDVDGDGYSEVITGTDQGGGPRITIFKTDSRVVADFMGIEDANFRGGARVGAGDINGDGKADVVVSAGFMGGPRIAVFDGAALATGAQRRVIGDFFAYDPGLRNGAFVTAGDLNGDGYAEIVTGAGPGGGPHVRAFDGFQATQGTLMEVMGLFAGNPESRNGVHPNIIDLNGSGVYKVISGSAAGDLSAYHLTGIGGPEGTFQLGGDLNAVWVDGGDFNGDGTEESIVLHGGVVQIIDRGQSPVGRAITGIDTNNNNRGLGSVPTAFSVSPLSGTAGTTVDNTVGLNRPNIQLNIVQGDTSIAYAQFVNGKLRIEHRTPGTTNIRIQAYLNGYLDGEVTLPVTTNGATLAGVADNYNLPAGQSVTVNYGTNPTGLTVRAVLPANPCVAVSIANGQITFTGLTPGTCGVRFELINGSGWTVGWLDVVVTVGQPLNAPPNIANIGNQTLFVAQDGNLTFQVSDPNSPADQLTVTLTSSNPNVVPVPTLGGSGTNRTATFTPLAVGQSTITATVTDPQGLTATDTFVITVPNRAPAITDVPNLTLTAGQTGSSNFGAVDSDNQAVTVTATSSNTGVVPNGNITLSGTGNNRTVSIAAPSGVSGTTVITLTATDAMGLTATDTFTVTVNPPANTPPTISDIGNVTLNVGDTANGTFTVNDAETPNNLTVTATSGNNSIATVTVGGTGTNRTISVHGVSAGTVTMTVTVTDPGGLTATDTFVVTVNPQQQSGITVDVSLRDNPGPDVNLSNAEYRTVGEIEFRTTSPMSNGAAFLRGLKLQFLNWPGSTGLDGVLNARVGNQIVQIGSISVVQEGQIWVANIQINDYLSAGNATLATADFKITGTPPAATWQVKFLDAIFVDQDGNDIAENVIGQVFGPVVHQ